MEIRADLSRTSSGIRGQNFGWLQYRTSSKEQLSRCQNAKSPAGSYAGLLNQKRWFIYLRSCKPVKFFIEDIIGGFFAGIDNDPVPEGHGLAGVELVVQLFFSLTHGFLAQGIGGI